MVRRKVGPKGWPRMELDVLGETFEESFETSLRGDVTPGRREG